MDVLRRMKLIVDTESMVNSFVQYLSLWVSLVAQIVKNLPVMQETGVQSPGRKDPLEKEMETHSSILAWRIPIDSRTWLARVHGVAKSRTQLSDFTFTF